MEATGANYCGCCVGICNRLNGERSWILRFAVKLWSAGETDKGTCHYLWRFQPGDKTDAGRDRLQGSRLAFITTQSNGKTPIAADPRISSHKVRLESKCRSARKCCAGTRERPNYHFFQELEDLMVLTPRGMDQVVKMAAITRSAFRRRQPPEPMRGEIVKQIRTGESNKHK